MPLFFWRSKGVQGETVGNSRRSHLRSAKKTCFLHNFQTFFMNIYIYIYIHKYIYIYIHIYIYIYIYMVDHLTWEFLIAMWWQVTRLVPRLRQCGSSAREECGHHQRPETTHRWGHPTGKKTPLEHGDSTWFNQEEWGFLWDLMGSNADLW